MPDAAAQAAFETSKQSRKRAEQYIIFAKDFHVDGVSVLKFEPDSLNYPIATINAANLPTGASSHNVAHYKDGRLNRNGYLYSYQGFHAGSLLFHGFPSGENVVFWYGNETPVTAIPSRGKTTYTGTAYGASFSQHDAGEFTYHVDFSTKLGYGTISGVAAVGEVKLQPTAFQARHDDVNNKQEFVFDGIAETQYSDMRYVSRFYGPQAEEMAGGAAGNGVVISFHGTRGAVVD